MSTELIHEVLEVRSRGRDDFGVLHERHIDAMLTEINDLRARLAAAEADKKLADEALAEVQAALYRWLPSCDGGKYDDLIKADADKLLGMEHDANTREIGSEILAEKTAAESRLREYEDAPVVAFQYYDTIGRRHFTRLGETAEQIGYECQPLIIRPRGGKGE